MPELGDELRRLADKGAQEALPMTPAEVMRNGDHRRHRRALRDGFAAVGATGAVVAGILSGTSAGPHAIPRHRETRPPILTPSPVRHSPMPTPTPSRSPADLPAQLPSPAHQPPPTPTQSPTPAQSHTTHPTPSPSPSAEPTAPQSTQPEPSPTP